MNLRSYLLHVTGFISLAALAVYPWIGLAAAVASIVWARRANYNRAHGTEVRPHHLRRATAAQVALCVFLQSMGLYHYYSTDQALYGAFSVLSVMLISVWVFVYVYMFFPDGIPRKAKG